MSGVLRGRDVPPGTALLREAEVCVVGTGAGGAMAARELARAGRAVVALEAGGYHTPRDFDQREDDMVPLLFEERGGRGTADLGVRILQGRGVGGSTVHNTCICKRTPPEILDAWAEEFGLEGARPADLEPLFAATESELGVTQLGEGDLNANNQVLRRGAQALGLRAGFLCHNRKGCVGSGFCELGCSFDAKQNALKVLVPDALAHGGAVIADARAERVLTENGRAVGVEGTLLGADGRPRGTLRVRARAVCLAGSAIGSAMLVQRSQLPDPHRLAGASLHLHPGVALAGVFAEPIVGWKGIPQVYECTELLRFTPGSTDRVWIVPAFAHPIGTATELPGFGADHARLMREYANLAVLTAVLHDQSAGRVEAPSDPAGRPKISYALDDGDARALVAGMTAVARILFAAGARRVLVPHVRPLLLQSPREIPEIERRGLGTPPIPMTAVHPMGTLRMGADPARSVCDSRGRHHQVAGLYVCDGSLFPTSIGVPPQISIYTFARRVAATVHADLG